jgi:hypothetical protein
MWWWTEQNFVIEKIFKPVFAVAYFAWCDVIYVKIGYYWENIHSENMHELLTKVGKKKKKVWSTTLSFVLGLFTMVWTVSTIKMH